MERPHRRRAYRPAGRQFRLESVKRREQEQRPGSAPVRYQGEDQYDRSERTGDHRGKDGGSVRVRFRSNPENSRLYRRDPRGSGQRKAPASAPPGLGRVRGGYPQGLRRIRHGRSALYPSEAGDRNESGRNQGKNHRLRRRQVSGTEKSLRTARDHHRRSVR